MTNTRTNMHTFRWVVLIMAVLSLGLAACGSESDVDAGGSTSVTTTPGLRDSDMIDNGQAEVVTPQPGQSAVTAVAWEGFTAIGDDDRKFLVTFWGGVEPCFIVDRVEVVESEETVTVTVYAGSSEDAASGNTVCIQLAKNYGVEIELSAPLRGRSVIDGA